MAHVEHSVNTSSESKTKNFSREFCFLKTHFLIPKVSKESKIHIKKRQCHMIWHTYLGQIMNEGKKINESD